MEIKIVNKAVEVEREWKCGDVFTVGHVDSRMIVFVDGKYRAVNLCNGVVMTTNTHYDSIERLMEFYTRTFAIKHMKATLTLTEE